nr:hypothetical protein [uncultured Mediterraneibacter sp.]
MTLKCVCRLACEYTFHVAEVYGARRQRDEAKRNRAEHGEKAGMWQKYTAHADSEMKRSGIELSMAKKSECGRSIRRTPTAR